MNYKFLKTNEVSYELQNKKKKINLYYYYYILNEIKGDLIEIDPLGAALPKG